MSDLVRLRRVWLAPALDFACIVAFILVGAGRHNISEGAGWFFTVLWPIAVGWYGVALVTRLYTRDDRWTRRLVVTIAIGTAVMSVLRGAFTDRPWISVFTVVYIAWMVLTAFGWRLLARSIDQWRRRRAASTAESGAQPLRAS